MKLGYARVSREDQNLDLQLDALKAAGAERIFTDKASGAYAARPGLNEMLGQLRAGDTVIVWRLDRLARSLKDLIELAARLEANDVGLMLLNERIDTSSVAGRLFFQIFGAIAEFERNLIRERTSAGLAAAKARGKTGGRRRILDADKQRSIAILVEAARAKGEAPSARAIANTVGASERTIRRFIAGQYE